MNAVRRPTSSGRGVDGLPHLLSALARPAHPDDVAAALVDGPGRAFGAVAAAICWARPPNLVVVGLHGFLADETHGLETVALDMDHPLPEAFHQCLPVVVDAGEFARSYSVVTASSRSARVLNRVGPGTIVAGPIVARGVPVGCFALLGELSGGWQPTDVSLLDTVGCGLGVWLTHPASGLPVGQDPPSAVSLTARQRALLVLLADGRTTESAAVLLKVSPSTVKQEVARIVRALCVQDRGAAVVRARELGLVQTPMRARS